MVDQPQLKQWHDRYALVAQMLREDLSNKEIAQRLHCFRSDGSLNLPQARNIISRTRKHFGVKVGSPDDLRPPNSIHSFKHYNRPKKE